MEYFDSNIYKYKDFAVDYILQSDFCAWNMAHRILIC